MRKIFSAFWKILLLTVVYFIINAIMGMLLPLSNDTMAAMTPEDRAAFMPLFLLKVFFNMVIMYLLLAYLRYKGWKLFLGVWMALWGLITVLNFIELYWYNEAFPLFTYLDVTKMIIISLISFYLLIFSDFAEIVINANVFHILHIFDSGASRLEIILFKC